jgi:hypothetical protein
MATTHDPVSWRPSSTRTNEQHFDACSAMNAIDYRTARDTAPINVTAPRRSILPAPVALF